MNSDKEDIGVLRDYTFDLAYGKDENDFECKVDINNHVCKEKYYLYIEGSEYGGIIDNIQVDSEKNEIIYSGRTWHGILESKVLIPESGQDYYYASGDLNSIISDLLDVFELKSLFIANDNASGKIVSNYQFPRYIKGYSAIKKLLKDNGYKLDVKFMNGTVCLSAVPFVDYSCNSINSDLLGIKIKKCYNPINHVICLGKGELHDRIVLHIYADETGAVSEKRVFSGIDENVDVYDYPSAESEDDLIEGGIEIINRSWNGNTLSFNFDADDEKYDVGDVVGATERVTNISVTQMINKKIVSISNNQTKISYEVGD